MSPPEKLPDNLWAGIQDVTQRMAAFLVQAQQEVINPGTPYRKSRGELLRMDSARRGLHPGAEEN